MNRRIAGIVLSAITVLWMVPAVSARPVRMWSYKELMEEADLVVIGTAGETADAKGYEYPNAKADTCVVVRTVFEVKSVVKGTLNAATVTVEHYRYSDPKAEITTLDGPVFVRSFAEPRQDYLVYLKQGREKVYEPLAGQTDPWGSFFLLRPYSFGERTGQSRPGATTRPIGSEIERSVVIAVAAVKGKGLSLDEHVLTSAERITWKGRYVWRITYKPARFLPADPSMAPIGEGGEVFVNVDLGTGEAEIRYGE